MKRLVVVLWGTCACAWLGSVAAQEQAPATIEIFADCHYIGNKGINDLHAAAAKFNAWADRHNIKDYSAYILTPYAYSDDITADFLWLGTWPNGVAMGGETKTYLAEGAQIRANFLAIAKCRSHGLFVTGVVNTPQGPPPEKNGVIVFQNGTLKEGHIASEVLANVPPYVDYLKKHGNDVHGAAVPDCRQGQQRHVELQSGCGLYRHAGVRPLRRHANHRRSASRN